jgi:hypothetical protein
MGMPQPEKGHVFGNKLPLNALPNLQHLLDLQVLTCTLLRPWFAPILCNFVFLFFCIPVPLKTNYICLEEWCHVKSWEYPTVVFGALLGQVHHIKLPPFKPIYFPRCHNLKSDFSVHM